MKSYLKEAATSPAHWYQAGQIAFREGDFVSACTYVRRGIAANPYIAEGLTGRTKINEHLYWHASNRNGPDWATDYLSAPVCDWSAKEIDFVDWVFNSSAVLRERASLMDQHEGLTYERDAVRREPFALRSSYFVNGLTDNLSKAMVKKIQNRYGVEIWPWERAGFNLPRLPGVDPDTDSQFFIELTTAQQLDPVTRSGQQESRRHSPMRNQLASKHLAPVPSHPPYKR
jgi:hypothetical protein